jgi:hypothetical protein
VLEDHRVGVNQVLNIGTGRRPRMGDPLHFRLNDIRIWLRCGTPVWICSVLVPRWEAPPPSDKKGSSTPLRHRRLWLGWIVCIIHDIINYMIYAYTQSLSSSW